MSLEYAAAMPRRDNLLGNPDGRIPVIEHALHSGDLQALCGDMKSKLEVLHHTWNPESINSCPKCIKRYLRSKNK